MGLRNIRPHGTPLLYPVGNISIFVLYNGKSTTLYYWKEQASKKLALNMETCLTNVHL